MRRHPIHQQQPSHWQLESEFFTNFSLASGQRRLIILGKTPGDFKERLVRWGQEQDTTAFIPNEHACGDILARQTLGNTGIKLDLRFTFVTQIVREYCAVTTVVRLLVVQGASLGRSAVTVSVSSRTGCSS